MYRLILACLFVGSALCANLAEVLQAGGQHTTLLSLVQQAGLADTLLAGQYTIFAPTDNAFSNLPQDLLNILTQDKASLENLLKYHVVQGSIPSSAASNELQLQTLNGAKIRFNIYSHNNVVTIEGAKITEFDKATDNGYIHVIDRVMMPPEGSIVDIVSANKNLTTLLQEVTQTQLVSALQGQNLTLFAPTNAAFARLGSYFLNNLEQNPSILEEVLLYHVVPHTEYSEGIYNREYLRTLDKEHDVIRIGVSGSSKVYVNNAKVTSADISATNGVVHVIDHVLVPLRYLGQLVLG